MKSKKIAILLLFAIGTNFLNAQDFQSHINDLSILPKHTDYTNFDKALAEKTGPYLQSFISEFITDEKMILLDLHLSNPTEKRSDFFNVNYRSIPVGRYDLNPNVITLLYRGNYDNQGNTNFSLINFKKEGSQFKPIARLSVYVGTSGEFLDFSFNTNKVIVTSADESTYALGVAYEIDDAGNFIEVHRQEFNEATYQDHFKYNGSNVHPSLDTYIAHISSVGILEINNNKVLVANLYDIFKQLEDDTVERLVHYFPNNSTLQTLSIAQIKSAVGSQDSDSNYYDIVAPFDLWLEDKIEKHLLKTYTAVEFDNY